MRIPQPCHRTSTGTWHVVIDGKQWYLGRTEQVARENFERLMGHSVKARGIAMGKPGNRKRAARRRGVPPSCRSSHR